MKQGVILVNPYQTEKAAQHQPRRLFEEFSSRGVHVDVVPNEWLGSVAGGNIKLANDFCKYDFCVYLDKDKYLPRMLERTGMRLFNRAEAVELCDDKMLTHIALTENGVPMPATVPAPLCYKSENPLHDMPINLGYPVVVKECYGSFGKQVYLAENEGDLASIREKLKCKPHLYQEFIKESRGQDIRVLCVGGEIVAAMRRISDTDFRSNLALGGRAEKCTPDAEMPALAKKISQILGLDYCGIDLLLGKDGYLVCEVNSNAFFGGLEQSTGVDIAGAYTSYIIKTVYGK